MDNPRVVVEPLDIDNYDTWSKDMKWLLISRGLWDAISDAEKATKGDSLKALALIGLSVAKHHKASIAACEDAASAWELLEAAYKAKSNARRLQLKRDMNNLRMGVVEPLSVYIARGRGIMDQLLAAGHDVKEEELVWSLLAGLPGDYESMVNVLEGYDDTPSLDTVTAKLLIIEQRMQRSSSKPGGTGIPDVALYTKVQSHGKVGQGRSKGPVCWHCGKSGHIKKECPELMGKQQALIGMHTIAL